MVEADTEVMMRHLLTGLLISMAAVALLATGCMKVARAPAEQRPGDDDPYSYREYVAEVVVTAERPAWLMPEVVVSANLMPEVVVYATWSPATVAAASRQASFVN
jgi:hypothetical protein